MKISVSGKTDPGRRRSKNEDDLAVVDLSSKKEVPSAHAEHLDVGPQGVLLAVCDGVGGRRAGEVASALALESLSEEMEKLSDGCPRRELFRTAVENVNRRVWDRAHDDPSLEGMATTLTAALVCRNRAVIAHVGDSRAYVLRGDSFRQITRDQSFVASLVESGAMNEEDAARSPFRNVILQAIGRKKRVEVALDAVELESGDRIVLCTDGLSAKLRPDEIAAAVRAHPLPAAVDALVADANARGGEDNITVLAARIEE